MQKEFDAEGLPVEIRILGVNEAGHESGNAAMCDGKDLPWLQDVASQRVWISWSVTFRDVVILDEENMAHSVYNLTDRNLDDPANYEALRAILRKAAGGP